MWFSSVEKAIRQSDSLGGMAGSYLGVLSAMSFPEEGIADCFSYSSATVFTMSFCHNVNTVLHSCSWETHLFVPFMGGCAYVSEIRNGNFLAWSHG